MVQWTPWFNVPIQRRLELFSMVFMVFVFFGIPFIIYPVLLALVYFGNIYVRTLVVLYLGFVYYDVVFARTGDRGGRGQGVAWIRNFPVWKYCLNYYPLDLIKTVDLPADRNYLICFFPHGILSYGMATTFCTNHSKWPKLFPGIRSKCATLAINMITPVSRELSMSLGSCSASANSLTRVLTQSNDPKDKSNQDGYTANALSLVVGGAEESFYAIPNTYKFVLKNRKGFIKIALKTGASLVPAISFGENNIFEIIDHKPGSWGRFFQDKFKQLTKIAPVQFNGRGLFQYNFGLIPKRHPINIVIGAPILEKIPNPTQDDIDRVHKLFCEKLIELFETHKSKYVENSDKVHVEII